MLRISLIACFASRKFYMPRTIHSTYLKHPMIHCKIICTELCLCVKYMCCVSCTEESTLCCRRWCSMCFLPSLKSALSLASWSVPCICCLCDAQSNLQPFCMHMCMYLQLHNVLYLSSIFSFSDLVILEV